MAAQYIKLYEANPELRKLEQIVRVLESGGVIIYPTDTVYGIGCDFTNARAVQKVCRLKNTRPETLSFICYDLSQVSEYIKGMSTPVFKVIKKALPGPFTFILNANSNVPKTLNAKKKTVGIRVPNNNIIRELVRLLGKPIITTSIQDEDEVIEYSTDPELILEKYGELVDVVIDGGYGGNVASTVVDCSNDDFEVVREGLGDIDQFL